MSSSYWRNCLFAVLLGVAGLGIALSSRYRSDAIWPVWASLAVSLCSAAGLVGGYGLDAWRSVSHGQQIPLRNTAVPTALLGIGVLLVLSVGELSAARPGSGWRGDLLVAIACLGGGLAGATMFGIRHTANLPLPQGTFEQREQAVVALVSLRRLLQRLTTALGSLVALSTLALGASVLMTKNPAKELVVVFGAGGSILVGAFYVPAAAALRGRGERLSAAIFVSAAPTTTTELVERLEQRSKLEQLMGVDRTAYAELSTALPVLSPLIASAAIFLPK
ncbi:hypothetical protein ACWZHB_12895 [Nocardia sp. FBN12]|uniref:hypothetical protein n=1 Tax=Nocardia sp. FBN12 TaxID=3419766 RepID=UPI003D0124B3